MFQRLFGTGSESNYDPNRPPSPNSYSGHSHSGGGGSSSGHHHHRYSDGYRYAPDQTQYSGAPPYDSRYGANLQVPGQYGQYPPYQQQQWPSSASTSSHRHSSYNGRSSRYDYANSPPHQHAPVRSRSREHKSDPLMYKIGEDVHRFLKQMCEEMRRETTPYMDVIMYRYEHGSFEQPNGYIYDTMSEDKERQAVAEIVCVPYDPIKQYACCEDADYDGQLRVPVDYAVSKNKVECVIVTNYESWLFLHQRHVSEDEFVQRHNNTHRHSRSRSRHEYDHAHSHHRSLSRHNTTSSHHGRSLSRGHSHHRSGSVGFGTGKVRTLVAGQYAYMRNKKGWEVPELLIDEIKRAYAMKLRRHSGRGRLPVHDMHPISTRRTHSTHSPYRY